jgi:carbonic anhydrase/acetyltransferase-like protein (isoleucine patch superfamily)
MRIEWLDALARFLRLQRLRLRAEVGAGVQVAGRVWLPGRGRVTIGARARLSGPCAPVELRAEAIAELVVEDDVVIEEGCSIEATQLVRIGARTRMGAFCKILDNHLHDPAGDFFHRPPGRPVVIEEDCIIGPRAILLPGAHVGRGSRVGPGTVVSRRIPPHSCFAGVPPTLRSLT